MLSDFYRITKIPMGLYDLDGTLIMSFSSRVESFSGLDFCERCKLCSPRWLEECMNSDRDAFEAAQASGKPFVL